MEQPPEEISINMLVGAAGNRESLKHYLETRAPIQNPSSEELRERMGLPEGVSAEEQDACAATFPGGIITQLTPEKCEARRAKFVKANRLPDDATWTDIIKADVECGRKAVAAMLGLDKNSTWTEIATADKKKVDAAGPRVADEKGRITTVTEVYLVARNLGIFAGQATWGNVLAKLQRLGIKTN